MNSKKEVQHVYLVGAKSLGAYGGYETFVYKLTEYHQNKENIKYHVACKANGDGCMDENKFEGVTKINNHEFELHNAHCFKIDVPQIGPAQAIYYDVAALKACCEHIKKNHIPHPIVYIMACRIGPFAGHFYREIHKLGGTVYLNPDGHEWMRAKWSAPIRKYWKISEQMMVKYCDLAICDSVNLGHTVLRKSVSTNFKLHKRKTTDEDEQYVFYNTHEPIISQELWDSVQKRKKRANRAAARGTHTNRLSGYLYCADCGRRMTLQTHYSKKDGSIQYSYRCGGYASRVNSCTSHTISADNVEALILSAVKRFSRFVLNDEKAFALELQSLWKDKQEEKPKHNQSELKRCQKRYDELSTLIRGLYENLISGLLPERQYKQLMKQYDDEQAELEAKMETMKKELSEEKDSTMDIQHFISLIRKYKNPTEVSDLMFTELIDKIVVYEAEGVGKAKTQKVDIYFNYVGQVDIAYTEEELAEIKEQEEQEEKKRLEKQRQREKAYREKRKAKKLAENGGEIVKTKVCPHCGKEFTPTSNRQIFCSKDCCYQARQDKTKADREAEKGDHYYRQRVCAVCGSTYWPTHSQQKFCSEECKKVNHNKKTLEFYYKKQKEKELCKDLLQTKEQVSDTNSSEITIIPA